MLTELCAVLRNYFCTREDIRAREYEISGGRFTPPLDFLQDGQYYRIVGSVFNDGVHLHGADDLTDEAAFDGAVWPMRVPPAVVALAEEIKAYRDSDAAKPSPFTAESFGGYSYSKATGQNGAPISWKVAFADRLREWRKL